VFCKKTSGPLDIWLILSSCKVFSFFLRILSQEWYYFFTEVRLNPRRPTVTLLFRAMLQLVFLFAVFPVLGNVQQGLHPKLISKTSNNVFIDPLTSRTHWTWQSRFPDMEKEIVFFSYQTNKQDYFFKHFYLPSGSPSFVTKYYFTFVWNHVLVSKMEKSY